jgi:hypothetical protein
MQKTLPTVRGSPPMKQASRAAALVASAAIGAAGDSVKLTVLAGTGTHQITVTLGSVP